MNIASTLRRITGIAAVAGTAALFAAGTASAASVPNGTFGRADGTAFLSAVGPVAQVHPSSSGFTKFTVQTGVEQNTSFALTEVAPNAYVITWTGRPAVHGKNLVSDFRGFVGFSTTPDVWSFALGHLTDTATGRKLCVGPPAAISTVPSSSTAACTDLVIVTP